MGQERAGGRIVDLGVAGFGIFGDKTYPAGSRIELRFRAPESVEDLRIKAVVCFSTGNRMGVQAISIPADQARILETIYERISRRQHSG